ncbi:DUF1178 family protein [Candidatus Pelagibacter sp.]|nr:DUF1178 family protein [Candidatus Pelagibacter sp.]
MIKYQLICKECKLTFDSWFASSKEFEKLKKKNFLSCHNCNSIHIEKSLMKPNVLNKRKSTSEVPLKNNNLRIKKTIKEYQNFIKNNFDYVGSNFAYEARSIHYDKKKRKKGIFGKPSKNEIIELKEEGIETQSIPWIEDKNN